MTAVARAELEIDSEVTAAFGKLVNFGAWGDFMPEAFRPVRGPKRALEVGDRIVVRMQPGLIAPLRVVRVEANRELCWRGGIPGVFVGEHAFYFEDLGGGRTRVRSEEPFTGFLTLIRPVRERIERDASAVGRQMLESLRRALG